MRTHRRPPGQPTGGQFAPTARPAPAVSLTGKGPGPGAAVRTYAAAGVDALAGYDSGEGWNGSPQPWLTEEAMDHLAAATATHCEVDKDAALVYRDAATGRWMVDEGAGWEDDGRTYPVETGATADGQPVYRLSGWMFDDVTDDDAADPDRQPHTHPA